GSRPRSPPASSRRTRGWGRSAPGSPRRRWTASSRRCSTWPGRSSRVTVDLGEGAHAVLARPCRGTVVAVYRRAAYLRLDGEIVALVDASVAPGPLHVRCAAMPPLRVRQPVAGDGTRLAGGHWALRVDGPVWRGALPDADALGALVGD